MAASPCKRRTAMHVRLAKKHQGSESHLLRRVLRSPFGSKMCFEGVSLRFVACSGLPHSLILRETPRPL